MEGLCMIDEKKILLTAMGFCFMLSSCGNDTQQVNAEPVDTITVNATTIQTENIDFSQKIEAASPCCAVN